MFNKTRYFSLQPDTRVSKTHPEAVVEKLPGLRNCASCKAHLPEAQFIDNLKVCLECGYHHTINAWERINSLVDENSFSPLPCSLRSHNILGFPGYDQKLDFARQESGLEEAIVTGTGTILGYQIVLGVMDSRFMMGSMGSVVGEKICQAAEQAILSQSSLVLCTCSGGARMQEGMLSLLQMAKTCAVIERLHGQRLLYVSILTNPTTGGVSASFASLADIIIAEPGALIGFTGPRVIEQTIHQHLPEDFQRSEYLLKHGMIDMIVPRNQIRTTLADLLSLHQGGNHG